MFSFEGRSKRHGLREPLKFAHALFGFACTFYDVLQLAESNHLIVPRILHEKGGSPESDVG